MLDHLRAGLPNEACGLLAGLGNRVTHVLAADNIAARPRVEYEMDPGQQLQRFEFIEAQGLDLVGIYHSHPFSPAHPSATDLARAFYPEAVYVIVSLIDVHAPQVNGFLLPPPGTNSHIQQVEIFVENLPDVGG